MKLDCWFVTSIYNTAGMMMRCFSDWSKMDYMTKDWNVDKRIFVVYRDVRNLKEGLFIWKWKSNDLLMKISDHCILIVHCGYATWENKCLF